MSILRKFTLLMLFFILISRVSLAVATSENNLQRSLPGMSVTTVSNTSNLGQSANWSGYAATGSGFTGVTGTWTIPQISSSNYGAAASWVGIGGVSSSDIIQAGTQESLNYDGSLSYEAFYEELPNYSQPLSITVKPGDSVTVSINELSNNKWKIVFRNNSNNTTTQILDNYNSSYSSAEWIQEAPSNVRSVIPLANFGKVDFENTTAIKNGNTYTLTELNAKPIAMINILGQDLANPSNIGTNGTSFEVDRTNNQVYVVSTRRSFRNYYHPISFSPIF